MRKILKFTTAIALCMSMTVPAFAADVEESTVVSELQTETLNELEYYLELRELSNKELNERGYSVEEVNDLREFSIEEVYLERSKLSYETLVAYGYNDEQIEVIKNYDGSTITADSPIMLAASEMSVSKFVAYKAGKDGYEVEYNWQWSSCPAFKSVDKIVVYWDAHDLSGGDIDITANVSNCYADVMYYEMTTGNRASSQDETVDANYSSTYDAVSVDIDMSKSDNYYWAKKGVFHVDVAKKLASSEDIGDVDFGAGYGHSTVNLTGSIGYTVGSGFAITFTPTVGTNKVSNVSCTYTYKGSLTNHGEF